MTEIQVALAYAVFAAYVALLAIAAACDVWKFIVPNSVSLGLAGLFLVAAAALPGDPNWLSHLGAGGAVLACGMILFSLGTLGGGDVKLLAAVSLWAGFEHLLDLLVIVSLAGGALALLLVIARRGLRGLRPALGGPAAKPLPRVLVAGESIPYAVAIAPAAVFMGTVLPVFKRIWL